MRRLLRVYLPALLLVVAIVALTYWLFPAPPRKLRLAAGMPEGAYMTTGLQYRSILARDGITLQVVETSGSVQNLALLQDPRAGVDIAFVQGGTVPTDTPGLESLASVFLEPLWIFARADLPVDRLAALKGRRVAVGAMGSGTRALSVELLTASGVTDPGLFLSIGGPEAVRALLGRSVDAAFFVTARPLPMLSPLIGAPDVRLVSLRGADAYARRYRHLTTMTLPAGALDLAAWLPATDVTLVAAAASLVAHETLHPAIADLLMGAATETHRHAQLFADPGAFPSPRYVEFPLSAAAQRYFRSGPSFLRRHLPFWVASLVERMVIILLPLATLGIPLIRMLPEVYAARFHRRIHLAYGRLRVLEHEALGASDAERRASILERLQRLENDVVRLRVPTSHGEALYQLRTHIDFIRQRLTPWRG